RHRMVRLRAPGSRLRPIGLVNPAEGGRQVDVQPGWCVQSNDDETTYQAALAGASSVTCVDSSAHALEWVNENARRNGVAERVSTEQGDAIDFLKACRDSRRQFDLILLDPPSLIPRRKFHTQGLKSYHQLNQLALKLLSDEGILITSSCSSHLQPAELWEVVVSAARHDGRLAQVLEQGHQGPDHPIHPAMPETQYLKSLTVRA
ncbi:MAG TPA: methyltransferase domain-containing protein, partial [Accumulibacter sp.]|nr:methyltransferase domain-containing protein [Accumulibacter sp.]